MEQLAVPMTVQAQVGVRNNMASILHVSDNMPFELSMITTCHLTRHMLAYLKVTQFGMSRHVS